MDQLATEYAPRLRSGTAQEQQQAMQAIADFTAEYLAPHPQQVGELYSFADRQAGPGFTETMRYEHATFASDIRYFRTLADAPQPDVELFRSRLRSYIACMQSHLEREDMTIAAQVVEHEMDRRGRTSTTAER
ncbi:MAG: hemerythrin domain-containing protein [Phycisphaerales bacterium]